MRPGDLLDCIEISCRRKVLHAGFAGVKDDTLN
jgi:hypothetical protein